MNLYNSIISNGIGDWHKFYYGIMSETYKNMKLSTMPNIQLNEYSKIRDLIELESNRKSRNCLITVLFDAWMVEKIKTYSLNFEDSNILVDKLHWYYLKENVYGGGSELL